MHAAWTVLKLRAEVCCRVQSQLVGLHPSALPRLPLAENARVHSLPCVQGSTGAERGAGFLGICSERVLPV